MSAAKMIEPSRVQEPPPGFQRVVSLPGNYLLPWGEQMRLRWEWLQDWVYGLFK